MTTDTHNGHHPADDFAELEPHDLAAERAVLGAMMLSAAQAEACRQVLSPEDFYRPAYGMVFEALIAIMRGGAPADAVTGKDRLAAAGKPAVGGGAPELP